MRSRKITLVLHEGTPGGVRTAELSNWNGKVIIAPRAALKKLKELEIGDLPALYLLLGDENKVYVGETDALGDRLTNHALTKDFWQEMIAFVSPELSKTEVKYMEHVMVEKLREDGLVDLQNSTIPGLPTIRKEVVDSLEQFLDHASDVLLSLGYKFLGASHEVEKLASEGILVFCKGPGANATGVYSEEGLLVKKGSVIRRLLKPSMPPGYAKQREALIQNKVLVPEGEYSYILTADHLFSSPSAASDVVKGRNTNGLTEWKNVDGVPISELEKE